MSRANIYEPSTDEYSPAKRVGHFDTSKADFWTDADYNGNGSGGTGRGQGLYRTAGGKWVLCHWSSWQNESDTYAYASDDEAREWLLRNHEDEAVAKHFGPLAEEEDRRPGRPKIGGEVLVRLGDDLIAMVDAYAEQRRINRSEAIRRLVTDAVTRARVGSATPLSPRVNR